MVHTLPYYTTPPSPPPQLETGSHNDASMSNSVLGSPACASRVRWSGMFTDGPWMPSDRRRPAHALGLSPTRWHSVYPNPMDSLVNIPLGGFSPCFCRRQTHQKHGWWVRGPVISSHARARVECASRGATGRGPRASCSSRLKRPVSSS